MIGGSFTLDEQKDLVSVGLVNLQVDPHDVTQAIAGVSFVLKNQDGGRLPGTLLNPSAQGVTINPQTGAPELTTLTENHWVLVPPDSGSGSPFVLCRICPNNANGAFGGADQLIVGGPPTGGTHPGYYDVNGSLTNSAHEPLIWGNGDPYTPVFTLQVDGLASGATVSDVVVMFGTNYGKVTLGPWQPDIPPPPSVPEPGAAVLLAGGLIVLTARLFYTRGRCAARS